MAFERSEFGTGDKTHLLLSVGFEIRITDVTTRDCQSVQLGKETNDP